MDRRNFRLHVGSAEPGAVFRVTDGRAGRVATSMYRMDMELPQGVYTVSASMGQSILSQQVILDSHREAVFERGVSSFGDRAFAMAQQVLAKIPGSYLAGHDGAVITLRGPWAEARDAFVDDGITLDMDGVAIKCLSYGVATAEDDGIWGWQLFRIAPGSYDTPGIVTATRMVDGGRVSHVLPQFEGWCVWAAYPASQAVAKELASLPAAHYLRLRLTRRGDVPPLELQSLSDQVFTTLAGRGTLPFSNEVLDILFAKEADPLLAIAAAHVASLGLARDGEDTDYLPQDAEQSVSRRERESLAAGPAISVSGAPSPKAMRERIRNWLEQQCVGTLEHCPDIVALRTIFGIDSDVDLRRPPVLLRSLDALIADTHAARRPGRKENAPLDDSVWRTRFQVSDTFAYLQWNPDLDCEAKLVDQVRSSFELERNLVRIQRDMKEGKADDLSSVGGRPNVAASYSVDAPTLDPEQLASYLLKQAGRFRIPASAVSSIVNEVARRVIR